VGGDPGEVFVDITAVDDQHEVAGRKAIHEHVVDKRAVGCGQRGIVRLIHLKARGVVARDVLHRGEGVLAGNLDLAHVRHVEESGAGADSQVLGRDAGILHGHVPAAKGDHPRAKGDVNSVKRGLFQGSGSRLGHRDGGRGRLTVLCAPVEVKAANAQAANAHHAAVRGRLKVLAASGPYQLTQ
jgi:hypothetical protein